MGNPRGALATRASTSAWPNATRIARDLHDTFLQTIQGSKLVADDALSATSFAGSGTVITLTVPGGIIYRTVNP
jgi:hypothetical protein